MGAQGGGLGVASLLLGLGRFGLRDHRPKLGVWSSFSDGAGGASDL